MQMEDFTYTSVRSKMFGRANIIQANWGSEVRKPDNFQALAGQHSSSFVLSEAIIAATTKSTFMAYTVMYE